MIRSWFVSPLRLPQGSFIPGRFDSKECEWVGPSPQEIKRLRGPYPTAKVASEYAYKWKLKWKAHTSIWLVLVRDGVVTHCNRYTPPNT